MWSKEVGIDSFSYYYTLTPKQKAKIMESLKKLPIFYPVAENYSENTYSYRSDFFADNGVKIWISSKCGKP